MSVKPELNKNDLNVSKTDGANFDTELAHSTIMSKCS